MTAKGGALVPERQNIPAGIGLMVLGFVMFSANDALGKWLAATYTPGQILLLRSVFGLTILAPFIWRAGIRSVVSVERPWLHLVRVTFSTVETFLFYWAVSVLPLADAMTYYLAGPIYVTVLAAILLKERVGWRRWTAVGVGFLGVVIALQPTAEAFGWYALIAFAGSLVYAIFMVITRSVRGTPDLTMATWQFVAALIAGIISVPVHWVPFTEPVDAFLIGLLGVVALVAILCVNRSLKLAPASIVVPYQNTLIVWAILFGYIFFHDTPGIHLIVGAAIIIAACLYIFFREQKVANHPEPEVMSGP
jgi:drug/metabolite transporter (DMT)-like permease